MEFQRSISFSSPISDNKYIQNLVGAFETKAVEKQICTVRKDQVSIEGSTKLEGSGIVSGLDVNTKYFITQMHDKCKASISITYEYKGTGYYRYLSGKKIIIFHSIYCCKKGMLEGFAFDEGKKSFEIWIEFAIKTIKEYLEKSTSKQNELVHDTFRYPKYEMNEESLSEYQESSEIDEDDFHETSTFFDLQEDHCSPILVEAFFDVVDKEINQIKSQFHQREQRIGSIQKKIYNKLSTHKNSSTLPEFVVRFSHLSNQKKQENITFTHRMQSYFTEIERIKQNIKSIQSSIAFTLQRKSFFSRITISLSPFTFFFIFIAIYYLLRWRSKRLLPWN